MSFDIDNEIENEQAGKGLVVIAGTSEGFLTRGLETKLKDIGVESQFAGTNLKKIDSLRNETELYVIYVNDDIEAITECMVFIKDITNETDRKIIVISEKEYHDAIEKLISGSNILKHFDRPLDMEDFVKTVEDYYKNVAGENRKKSVLIVDDDITYMRMIYEWLKGYYHVGMASSGVQAISWLAKNKADLVLLDYEMPVANGPQVLEMLKNDSEMDSIPVMFLTGKSDRQSVMSVINLKPVDYLLKTIDKESLVKKLKEFFDSQRFK